MSANGPVAGAAGEIGERPARGLPGGPRPPLWMPGADLQTIVPTLTEAPEPPGAAVREEVEVAPGSRVLLWINRPEPLPAGGPRGTLLLIHGMEGSSRSSYMRYTAAEALGRGWVVVRMNLRTCGGSEHLSRTLYNAGQAEDAGSVLAALDARPAEFPRPFAAAGFSLGGNLLLRYAGLLGEAAAVDRFAAVNAPIDLSRCLDALERPRNVVYHAHYTLALIRKLRRILAARGGGPAPPLWRIRTLRRFDDLVTAPEAGYAGAADYYARASAAPVLSAIRRPTLVLSAANDPFVPVEIFRPHAGHPRIRFAHPAQGGHCGYWQRGPKRSWVAEALLDEFEGRG